MIPEDMTGPEDMTMETRLAVGDDGTRLSVKVYAGDVSQIPFVLVHGLSSNSGLWDEVARTLAVAGHGCYAPDLRGHGDSERPDEGYDFGSIASDLWAVLRDVVERQAILVGQSWGGNVVVEAAHRHPELARAVVCVDGGFIRLTDRHTSWDSAWADLQPPRFDDLTQRELEARLAARFAGWPARSVAGQLANFEPAGDGRVRPRLSRTRHQMILRALWGHDPDEVAAALDIPVWVVAVGRSDPAKAARVEQFAAGLRQGRVVWMDGDHDVHAEQPSAVADLLVDLALELS